MTTYHLPLSKLNMMTTEDTLYFVLSPYSGDADLFIAVDKDPQLDENHRCTNCILGGTTAHGEIKSVKKNDPAFPTNPASKFYIGVYGYTPADFLLNVYPTSVHAQLELGSVQVSASTRRQFTYFKFHLDDNSDFTISVTPINGDPDVYVSTSSQWPTSTDNEWSASLFGYDSITIRSTDPTFKANHDYYIGVYGFLDTYYSISINKPDTYIEMMEGIAASNYVQVSSHRYFKFTLKNAGHALSFSVDPLFSTGDPDMYITTDITSGPPSKKNHEWSAETFAGDIITIPNAEAKTYYVAIYGYGVDTSFQMLVQTEFTSTMLNDGFTQNGVVGPGYTYYKFSHGDSESSLTISVNPATQDSVEMYVSTETTRPDKNKHQFVGSRSENGGRFLYFAPPTNAATYYIAVYSANSEVTFTITAQTLQTASILKNAEPSYENQVPSGYYRLFVFDYPPGQKQDLSITVLPWEGDVDLYVSATVEKPTKTNYTWFSNGWREDTVVIAANDPNIANKNRVYISVYGASQTTGYFAIMALLSGSSVLLSDGAVVSGNVAVDRYQYYKFEIPNSGSININLELSSTDDEAHLYVSTHTQKPTKYDRDWASTEFGNDFLNIPNAAAGVYYIGVYGSFAAGDKISYTLSARQNHQSLPVNRFNMLEIAPKGSSYQFRTYVSPYSEGLMFATTLINGRTKMYISTNSSIIPDKDHHDFVSTSWPGNSVFIPNTNAKFKSGEWAVVVESIENSNYFISASSLPYFAYIREGVPRFGVAPPTTPLLYSYYIPFANETLQEDHYLSIRILNGAVDVFINQDYEHVPSENNYVFASQGPNDRLMLLQKSKLKFGRTMYIALYGVGESSHFEMALSKASTARYLALNQPQMQTATPDSYTFFRALNNVQSPFALKLVVESCTVEPAPYIYVSTNPDNRQPTKERNDYASTLSKNTRTQTVQTPKAANPEFFVGVQMTKTDAPLFSIYGSTENELKPIVPKPVLAGGKLNKNQQVTLTVPMALSPAIFEGNQFTFTAYLAELSKKNKKYEPINFETTCGIQLYGLEGGQVKADPTGKNVQITVKVDPKKEYVVNVIVSNTYGLSSAYQAAYILKGKFSTSLSPASTRARISVGGILILLGFLAIVAYLIIGSSVNAIKGERGISIIPNVEFWKDLPFLIWDGVKFVFTCGRMDRGYTDLDAPTNSSQNAYGSI